MPSPSLALSIHFLALWFTFINSWQTRPYWNLLSLSSALLLLQWICHQSVVDLSNTLRAQYLYTPLCKITLLHNWTFHTLERVYKKEFTKKKKSHLRWNFLRLCFVYAVTLVPLIQFICVTYLITTSDNLPYEFRTVASPGTSSWVVHLSLLPSGLQWGFCIQLSQINSMICSWCRQNRDILICDFK